jgi:hypothetical protein
MTTRLPGEADERQQRPSASADAASIGWACRRRVRTGVGLAVKLPHMESIDGLDRPIPVNAFCRSRGHADFN